MLASKPSLFLGVTPAQARVYLQKVFSAARGKFQRVIVPCAGRFSGAIAARKAGFKPEQIFTSDISLFSTLIGYLATGKDPHLLNIELNHVDPAGLKERMNSTVHPDEYAACVLFAMKLAKQPTKNVWHQMVQDDLRRGWSRHVAHVQSGLIELSQALKGMSYQNADVFDVIEKHAENKEALFYIDPPGFAGGYSKQFSTNGTLTWDEPLVPEFDPALGFIRLQERLHEKPALALILRARKDLAEDRDVAVWGMWDGDTLKYLLSNHPDRMKALMKGVFLVRKPTPHADPGFPVWGANTDSLRPDSVVRITWTKREIGLYYRDLFAHTLGDTNTERFALLWVDGKVFGTIGIHMQSARLQRKYKYTGEDDRLWVFESFGFSTRHKHFRHLNRLLMMCITCDEFRRFLGGPNKWPMGEPVGIRTACITKGHESKGNRGILKLIHREQREDGRFYLVYQQEWRPGTYQDQVALWV